MDGNFPEYIEFANEKDILIRQRVKYEWLPINCSHCRMFGHTQDVYRKKDTQKKEWRVRVQLEHQEHHEQQEQREPQDREEGFQRATKHSLRKPVFREEE